MIKEKRIMKKFLTLVLALLLVCSLASCSDKQNLVFGKELLTVGSQLDALNGLLKGDADIAVIDSVMAGYYMSSTEAFKDYQVLEGAVLAEEQYGIGAKKGNNALIGKINEAMIALVATDYATVAQTYGLTTELLVKADTVNPNAAATDASWDNVVASGKLIIGYTEFAPIAYHEGDGENAKFVGFDIDLAKAVVNYLNTTYSVNVTIEFELIDWNQKEALLENGTIDLVWNGMTITPERSENMAMSIPYLANKQVAVVKKSDAAKYGNTKDELIAKATGAIVIVEKGSAGEEIVCPVDAE